MARFVKVGKVGSMINVEQITAIYPNEKSDKYKVCMTSGSEHYVTYDEFLEITGQRQRQESGKKYAIKVIKADSFPAHNSGYLNINYRANLVTFDNKTDFEDWRASFTKKEIEELKTRDDIAIDWDKVELEEVDNA